MAQDTTRYRPAATPKANIASVGDGLDRPETYDIRERKNGIGKAVPNCIKGETA